MDLQAYKKIHLINSKLKTFLSYTSQYLIKSQPPKKWHLPNSKWSYNPEIGDEISL